MKLYSIFDAELQQFLQPFFAHNNAVAIRAVREDVNRPDSALRTPQDYSLYHIGEWSRDTGNITPTQPTPIAAIINLINKDAS